MKKYLKTILTVALMLPSVSLLAQEPIMEWSFDTQSDNDVIEGLYSSATGVVGSGVLLDGFTTRVVRDAKQVVVPGTEITIDAWVALGNYPWNWCPILTTESAEEVKGYRLMVGPYGEASMQVAIGEQWVVCTSGIEALPLRDWMHITGTYKAYDKIELYINGVKVNETEIKGRVTYAKADCVLGMTATEDKPSNIHRTWGTEGQYFGLDGILDEVKIYKSALDESKIKELHSSIKVSKSELEPRHFPEIMSTGKFKAYYTKLKYYPGWDNVWPVADDPDIVVCFENTPIRLTFWRGIRYGASWVSENNKWMTDQSVEAWGVGENDTEGCFEHMQDRHCRFSHVRIIENTAGRIVVHWRYAPVSSKNNTWRVDEKTGWECWVDEYYYIYPDGSAIRKVTWKKDGLGPVRQFQETLALLEPGQIFSDLVEREMVSLSDYDGKRGSQEIYPAGTLPEPDPYKGYTIQRYNYKSDNKPFICFEPGNRMMSRNGGDQGYNRAVGCNHFPVGQARCDGRTTYMSDRPSHATSHPISYPVIHNGEDRNYWCAMYGMTDMNMDDLQAFGRSWAYAPEIKASGKDITSMGYDRSERCYKLAQSNSKPTSVTIEVDASTESPAINPAFYIENWGDASAVVTVNGKKIKGTAVGLYETIDGSDLVVFVPLDTTKSFTITIQPE